MKPTKIQILQVNYPEGIRQMEGMRDQLENIRVIATRHGIRSLLVSPSMNDEGEGPEIMFAYRRHDDRYDQTKSMSFAREVQERLGIEAEIAVHSPDNGYLFMLTNGGYRDELGEDPVTSEEISAQIASNDMGFKRE